MVTKSNGAILWSGASLLDGAPIVVIAIGLAVRNLRKVNRKTGAMIQTYILRADMSPMDAIHGSADASICGSCVHRGDAGNGSGRTCYVNIGQGPTVVYKMFAAGKYPVCTDTLDLADIGRDRMVRLGTYGDPAAVPAYVWQSLLADAAGHTGYTHQWRVIDAATWSPLVMASADTAQDARDAWARGYRTFRVSMAAAKVDVREVLCPASKEAGAKVTCAQCKACSGTSSARKGSVYIPLHGGTAVMANAPKLAVRLIARVAV
jgi:hypothetical protein